MALPWLIGAAAVAAVSAVAAALSDDSSSSTSYSDNEAEERRRAERERRLRQLKEKREALEASYDERLELDSKKLENLLHTIAKVDKVQKSKDSTSSTRTNSTSLGAISLGPISAGFANFDAMRQRMRSIKNVSEIYMHPDGSHKNLLTRRIVENGSTLDEFHSNVVFFEQLYSRHVEPKAEVMQISETIDSLEKQAKKIDSLIKELG